MEKKKFNFGNAKEALDNISTAGVFGIGVYHMFQALRGKPVPEDSPIHGLSYGGLRSVEDQVAMDEIEKDLNPDQLKTWNRFKLMTRERYGEGHFGRLLNWLYGENFRSFMMRMREPEKTVTTTHKYKQNGKDATAERKRTMGATHKQAVNFLQRLIHEFDEGEAASQGSEEEKANAGYDRAIEFLRSKSFPTPSFIDGIKPIDEFIAKIPEQGITAATQSAAKLHTAYQQRMDRRRTELQEKSWWRRML